ncbi:MAG: oligosaccharide flippase family protein [Planctomycetes bacterium]|nr:oligosaccharide flippase family protein [Planctomycetota bacterium]
MTDLPKSQSINPEQDAKPKEDLTGRDRLVSSVFFSWASYLVFIIAGFIMPRMIDRRLGQELLGVWDFAWSLVTYFSLVQAGIGSSVNRYVARYRASGDITSVNQIVSSAFCILSFAGLLVMGLTIAVSLLLPQLFSTRLGEHIHDAQLVVFFLGASICIQITLGAFNGVLTGCHRWKLQNINISGWYAATVVGMIIALISGGGLWVLAVITFAGQVLCDVTRMILANKVCEGLQLRLSLVRWLTMKKLFVFGAKTLIPSVSNLLLNQTISIMIIVYLGPAMLALYARPRSLIRHLDTLMRKMAMILIPTTSSLQSTGKLQEIRELLIKSVRYSFFIVLPIIVMLVVFGGPILQFWMGPRYANGLIPAILATGYLAALAQTPILMILAGMNAHGRAGIGLFITSLFSVGLTVLAVGYMKWGLVGAAVGITLPLTILNIAYLPRLICRKVELSTVRYFMSVTVGPALHVLPFALCLVGARLIFPTKPFAGLLWGGSVGGTVLTILYWRNVLPDRIKMWVFHYPRKMLRSTGFLSTTKSVI